MNVFILWQGEYSDRGICGIFSTRELAEEQMKNQIKITDSYDHKNLYVQPVEVDALAAHVCGNCYVCILSPSGAIVNQFEYIALYDQHCRGTASRTTDLGQFRGVSYESAEHALKLAAEARQAYLRDTAIAQIPVITPDIKSR